MDLTQVSEGSGLKPVAVKASKFTVQTLQPTAHQQARLRVYIEGDGRAWITSRTVSNDPTPVKSMVPGLAVADPAPAVYLARPCQFVLGANCKQQLWTTHRFGKEVLQASSEVLDTLKSQYGVRDFELIGYSGGGAIALLLAANRTDVALVQTIAGNIDPKAWTELKGLTPLSGSMTPVDFADRLAAVPQRHLIGLNDTVVPPEVSQAYMLKVQPHCGETVFVDADHYAGFEAAWALYRDKPVKCEPKSGSIGK
ncbi:alpha/beta fold hydrolase [Pseudomonas aeruginosa]|uniref:alpha/beta fold hydrolase n=1 Tax=Pseudomonas aeruginosa TaxID=287 RepID=UPI001F09579C|nr:alpha/beta hydrolase [Pseudomonas aeruginosa]